MFVISAQTWGLLFLLSFKPISIVISDVITAPFWQQLWSKTHIHSALQHRQLSIQPFNLFHILFKDLFWKGNKQQAWGPVNELRGQGEQCWLKVKVSFQLIRHLATWLWWGVYNHHNHHCHHPTPKEKNVFVCQHRGGKPAKASARV